MNSVARGATRCSVFGSTIVGLLLFVAAGSSFGATPAPQLPDMGVLHLQLGSVDQFLWTKTGQDDQAQPIIDKRTRTGQSKDACLLESPPPTQPLPLLSRLTANGGVPGFSFDSIGVYGGGARGVDCSRVSGTESLTMSLAGSLATLVVRHTELDIEVKQNAWIKAVATSNGASQAFELRSGSSIGAPVPDGTIVFNCTARSDSGPDSGASDNCRWIFDAVWNSLAFTTVAGAWSLEGGADTGADSQFTLTQATGILDCDAHKTTITATGSDGAVASATRLDNTDGATCVPIPYLLVWRDGNELQFLKDDLGQAIAGAVSITWPNEPAPTVAGDNGTLGEIPLSRQQFLDTDPSAPIDLCVGTPVYVGGVFDSLTGIPPSYDLSAADGFQYACVLRRDVTYPAAGTIGLKELIFLQGDWTAGRSQ